MSGETAKHESPWTTDSLKEHIAALRAADKDALAIALTSADKATEKAENAQKVVNTSQNEFRATLKDQAATLMPRAEAEAVSKELRIQLDDLKTRVGKIENTKLGASESRTGLYAAIAAVGVVIGILVLLANGVL